MKLNKKLCRKFADPGIKMPLNNGILHAEQILYIVCTAVKIIDRHKTLVLYIYDRENAAQGDFMPCMTMFHCQDDFITLERRDEGSTAWRTSAFDHLDMNWSLSAKSAFYSPKDEERVRKYFKTNKSGFKALASAQDVILLQRRLDRQRSKEKRILNRMAGIPALPRGLKGWINRSVMPAYFFYDYKRGGKDVPGVCSACGKAVVLSNVKNGNKAACPLCKHELTMKPRSRRGSSMYDRDTCQVIQRTSDSELVVRILKVYYSYRGDIPDVRIYENARQFIYNNPDGKICTEAYYYSHNNGFLLTHWKRGERPKFSPWQECFEADTCGHLFTKNLSAFLAGTPWQYCPIDKYYENSHEPLQALPFLIAHLRHPRLEHLVKVGFYSIASDLSYRYNGECLDESKNRTHQILKVAPEDVRFLQNMDADLPALQIFQKYTGIKGRQELLLWQLEHKISRDIIPILQYMTPHKLMRYLDTQFPFLKLRRSQYGAARYKDMQDIVSEYRDYLEMCSDLEYNMKNSFILYPHDLQKSHDNTAKRYKSKSEAITKKKFMAAYSRIEGQMDYEKDGMKIVYPKTPDDMIAESHALHHCVDSYVSRVAKGECFVLFLRQCADESKPFYTIEIRGNKPVQVRGSGNCRPTPEVEDFIKVWEQKVLKTDIPVAVA